MKRSFSSLFLVLCSATLAACSGASDAPEDDVKGGISAPPGGARFFLPTGEPDNTAAPSVEVDAAGVTHAVYPAYAIGGAYYASCGAGCVDSDGVQVVRFETEGTTTDAMLALDRNGHPRILLSAYDTVYYGSCDSDCGNRASWSYGPIFEHDSERSVSGESLALDAEGRPRFLLHTRVAYLGIGQKEPETRLFACDAECSTASSWRSSVIAEEIWQSSHMRYDANGTLKVATVIAAQEGGFDEDMVAYLECAGDCSTAEAWDGIAFSAPYASELEAITIHPTVTLALTPSGAPRLAYLAKGDDGEKHALYFECDADCKKDNWSGTSLVSGDFIDAGLDLALDATGKPRVVFTHDFNIGLLSCDAAACTEPDTWQLGKVEAGADMPPDEFMPYANCTVGMWFLHSPSLALTASGEPRVGYQARDISGGTQNPDPTRGDCVAGTDMTWSRLALLPSVR